MSFNGPDSSSEISAEDRAAILAKRLSRTEAALREAETALEARLRELDTANRELQKREEDLARRLTIENRKLLDAQRTAALATVYWEKGDTYSSSGELGALLGLDADVPITIETATKRLHPLDHIRVFDAYRSFMDDMPDQQSHIFDHRIIRPDGETRWFRWALRKENSDTGEILRIYGSVRDVTEQRSTQREVKALQLRAERRVRDLKQLTGKLTTAKAQAETALQTRDKFLSSMGHYLRTPLSSLTGSLDLLAIEAHNPEEKRRVDVATRSAGQLSALITEMIEEAEGELSEVTLTPVPVNTHTAFQESIAYWQQIHPEASRLTLHLAEDLPAMLMVDPARFRILLDGLIGSCLDSGGDITLQVTWQDALILQTEVQGGHWPASLQRDTGQIEDPGLRFAHRLVRAMGGTIHFPQPSTLQISLPLDLPDPSTTARQDGALSLPDGRTPRVLLAEDTPTNRYVITSQLESLGCETLSVENGQLALDAISREHFDIILMDVMMPVLDGAEATQAIRALPDDRAARTPIIGITAHSLQSERDRLINLGMSACLTKPVRRDDLRVAIASYLTQSDESPTTAESALIDSEAFCQAFLALAPSYRPRLLEAVFQDIETYGRDLHEAALSGDEENMRRAAHSLKGVAGNIGANGLMDSVAQLRRADPAQAAEHWPDVERTIAASVTACGNLFTEKIANQ
ncbi:response regulator [Altericroceibacterium endophyticum]|uniref:histidine kinase n=1 Tax=Altericroceibacterium endophyticum TaxID=1808508 RepID=A0A6I4T774_9SPHN|nr:response regulator [Altericroceibacterium endophyticum]MXO66339.1 response regulator [Altericroceibacterium endophyticum]